MLVHPIHRIATSTNGPHPSSHVAREVEGLRKELAVVCSKPKGTLRMLQQKPKSIVFREPRFDETLVQHVQLNAHLPHSTNIPLCVRLPNTHILYLLLSRFAVGRKRARSKVDAERKKLLHKVKREKKGAIRELRKDSAFLAREKLRDQLEK